MEFWDKEAYSSIGRCDYYLCSVCKHRLSELAFDGKDDVFIERCGMPRCEAYPDEKPKELSGDKRVSDFAECDKFEKGLLIKTKLEGDRIESGDGFFVYKELDRDYRELDENTPFEEIIKKRIESAMKLAGGTKEQIKEAIAYYGRVKGKAGKRR